MTYDGFKHKRIQFLESIIGRHNLSYRSSRNDINLVSIWSSAAAVLQVGDEVTKDEPITTNPNVGGFGQAGGAERWGG